MEKKKSKRITETIVVTVAIICLGLIILQLKTNIQNELNVLFG